MEEGLIHNKKNYKQLYQQQMANFGDTFGKAKAKRQQFNESFEVESRDSDFDRTNFNNDLRDVTK
jgi:hypothetical protein